MKFKVRQTSKGPLPPDVKIIQWASPENYKHSNEHPEGEIEFDTLEQLMAFCERTDRLILQVGPDGTGSIEIYDDWRE